MINFIIVSHGELAEGAVNALEMILGGQNGIRKISLEEGDSIDRLKKRIEEDIRALTPQADGIVIMVDLFGASPFNMACLAASEYDNVQVVSGFNLPMLLEAVIQREHVTLAEMSALAESSGKEGISIFSELA